MFPVTFPTIRGTIQAVTDGDSLVLERFQPVVNRMLDAVLEDFRYAEAIARQAGSLVGRKPSRRRVGKRGASGV